ncbi:pentatricopeptide repeat-containing protein At2g06000-like [Ananas comosus]|uniref:Pentatricopeptide repeat-containing protein n=1 Tax=Ananas comosus TaxID=4615 RepID=A0A199UIC2_ANACO|nr:pentatricopeptide repeat-containing protein At2g06000-like [Ananas comosus]XP_020083343.1 pentatricopeptide repeat-containing protein At2g06000-like [Ananas comosus]XP_020083344.1 pentatricopeptide repeat-containing protein At2g06000-like [Ananas comosus]OAY64315.1 Pentatricopeptide repeat-containing protein [Ananas comosus]
MLLRGAPYPKPLRRLPLPLLLSSSSSSSSSAAAAPPPHPAELWIAKALATAFVLSPSARLGPFGPLLLTPLAASEALRRLPTADSALALFELARSALGVAHSPDAYRFLVGLLCRSGLHGDALKVFDEMASHGHSPDASFLAFVANSCAEAGLLDPCIRLLNRASEFNSRLEPYTVNKVMSLLIARNRIQDAVFLFSEQLNSQLFMPDAWSFNIVIKGLCRIGDIKGAFELFEKMSSFRCSPDTVTHNILVDGLCRAEQVDRGHEMLQRIRMDGTCMPNVVTYTSVISGYCKMGRMEEAFRVFNDMIGLGIKPSRVTYNVLIDGYGKAGDMPSAASVYERMALCGCPPDVVTITSLIDGHCRNGQLDDALKLWNEMGQRELRPNIYTFATMINFLCKKNRLGEAQVLLKELNERTDIIPRAFVYNPIIDGLCKVGNVDEANSIMLEMERKKCFPDKYTYTILIIGHCMKGRISEAIAIFEKMVATGCAHDGVTISCLVTCLLKAGMPNKVESIMLIASGSSPRLDTSSVQDSPLSVRKSADISVAV